MTDECVNISSRTWMRSVDPINKLLKSESRSGSEPATSAESVTGRWGRKVLKPAHGSEERKASSLQMGRRPHKYSREWLDVESRETYVMEDIGEGLFPAVDKRGLMMVGYSDGVSNGQASTYQSSFDTGYEQGFNFGFKLGIIDARSQVLGSNDGMLRDPRRINCQICINNNTDGNTMNLFNSQKEKNDQYLKSKGE